jgi:hypothetical protein
MGLIGDWVPSSILEYQSLNGLGTLKYTSSEVALVLCLNTVTSRRLLDESGLGRLTVMRMSAMKGMVARRSKLLWLTTTRWLQWVNVRYKK